jgi:hypothetical protein
LTVHGQRDGDRALADGLNGRRLTLASDAAYDPVINVASGRLDTADAIAAILQAATETRN